MDSVLTQYISSGKAWILVGSGPSIECGYPTWNSLAESALKLIREEKSELFSASISEAFLKGDFPAVFEEASEILGSQVLIHHLNQQLNSPSLDPKIYEIMAKWPVPVYLTTNFDDEIEKSLVRNNTSYITYMNTEDHMALLTTDLNSAIFKLHGDLRSNENLILTKKQYSDIQSAPEWQYWRTKLTSVFQMLPIVIIGHSLTDPHIRHILNAAKYGAGIAQPICWLAPDVNSSESRRFLEEFRIRVIPYENKSGDHKNLVHLLESISLFTPNRINVRLQQQVTTSIPKPEKKDEAALGFFVFNKLASTSDFEEKRIEILAAAIQSISGIVEKNKSYSTKELLFLSGWPDTIEPPSQIVSKLESYLLENKILVKNQRDFIFHTEIKQTTKDQNRLFEHNKRVFINSVKLRIRQKYPSLTDEISQGIAQSIESDLVTFFKHGGLSLASIIFSKPQTPTLPLSILVFIKDCASKFTSLLECQAYFTVAIDTFVFSGVTEREYLGRIAQGYLAFHILGAFGEEATARLKDATKTVLLIDSNALIYALANGCALNPSFKEAFSRLQRMGIRFFTSRKLLKEIIGHIWFADNLVKQYSSDSYQIISAAKGDVPFRKSNRFLEGFINWRFINQSNDWSEYLYSIFGVHNLFIKTNSEQENEEVVLNALQQIGIETYSINEWPGFQEGDNDLAKSYQDQIVEKLRSYNRINKFNSDTIDDPYEKALPESEALLIITSEREGKYHILEEPGICSEAWFISETSMLNIICGNQKITWQPSSFLQFASTLFPPISSKLAEEAFETLLLEFAQYGTNFLSQEVISEVFSGIIDQSKLSFSEQINTYHSTLQEKYGEDIKSVMERIPNEFKPLAAIQIASESLQKTSEQKKIVEENNIRLQEQINTTKSELNKLEKYKKKYLLKQQERARNKRKRIHHRKKK